MRGRSGQVHPGHEALVQVTSHCYWHTSVAMFGLCRKFDERRILGGVKLVWSNGSTDVAGEIVEDGAMANPEVHCHYLLEIACKTLYNAGDRGIHCSSGRQGTHPEAGYLQWMVSGEDQNDQQPWTGVWTLGWRGWRGEETAQTHPEGSQPQACLPGRHPRICCQDSRGQGTQQSLLQVELRDGQEDLQVSGVV